MDELAELQAQHERNHGPCGCLRPDQCTSVRHLEVIARLRARLTTLATLAHRPSTHGGAETFETCEIRGCRENAAALAGGEGGG